MWKTTTRNNKEATTMPPSTAFKPFLSSSEFIDQLRKEQRRADRSKSPLSIIQFHINEPLKTRGGKLKLFMDFLKNRTRETDIKGWVNKETIGVILTNTDNSGLERFVELINKENSPLSYTIVKATHPDNLIKSLLEAPKENFELFPQEMDHPQKSILQPFFKRLLTVSSSLIKN
ncbi:MAG: hypothetical protein AB1585_05440 [Thermodesulfobacteriota bacterium]